ncbi:DUF3310 domain-containing protein [Desulfosporosinus sp.]|uniref:DUF3310 domain-containing protein n=1 Tax=Desulfosporosinus sp. TaxID=157907 RepID=UPI0025B93B63|nr:DUF3310 domain-containing protein [Desulfosporosinus sp.]MBC2723234.1 DUF3310 domain-containing protein [Desulfosporosinus sp.]MBC2727109.1 DUF3310 domain-containing protein [Desulfosporosinus sp.]
MEYSDLINHLRHYTTGSIECIDSIKASMSKQEYMGYLKGNRLKYLWRYQNKNGIEDLHKCEWYLNQLITEIRGDVNDHIRCRQQELKTLEEYSDHLGSVSTTSQFDL